MYFRKLNGNLQICVIDIPVDFSKEKKTGRVLTEINFFKPNLIGWMNAFYEQHYNLNLNWTLPKRGRRSYVQVADLGWTKRVWVKACWTKLVWFNLSDGKKLVHLLSGNLCLELGFSDIYTIRVGRASVPRGHHTCPVPHRYFCTPKPRCEYLPTHDQVSVLGPPNSKEKYLVWDLYLVNGRLHESKNQI